MEHNRPVRIEDVLADPRTWDREAVRRTGARSWLAAPLVDGGRPFGVVLVASEAVGCFSEEDEGRLLSLAALAGSAIREARLRRQLERELDERKRAEASLFRREQEFRAVVEAAPDVIIRVDRDLRYVYVNPAFERVQGLRADALLGRRIGEAGLVPAAAEAWRLTLEQVIATGREQTIEIEAHVPSGHRVFQVRAAPEFGPDGRVENVVTVSRDVTERTRREEEQVRLYQELMEREKRLQDMMQQILLDQEVRRRRPRDIEARPQLTEREREILRLLAAGNTNQRIGRALGLSAGTVRNHMTRLLRKLGAADRTQAAIRAVEWGLLD
jgi:PAS domain S-box-containing protein